VKLLQSSVAASSSRVMRFIVSFLVGCRGRRWRL
jgi:hypothetical protein